LIDQGIHFADHFLVVSFFSIQYLRAVSVFIHSHHFAKKWR
jgi:hypothetical protein